MGRGILRGAGGDENLKFNFIWPYGFEHNLLHKTSACHENTGLNQQSSNTMWQS